MSTEISMCLPNLSTKQDATQGQFLSRVWIQSFPFSKPIDMPKLKSPFPRVLVVCEIQTASSRI